MSKNESNYFDGKHDFNFPSHIVICDRAHYVWILHLWVSDSEKMEYRELVCVSAWVSM